MCVCNVREVCVCISVCVYMTFENTAVCIGHRFSGVCLCVCVFCFLCVCWGVDFCSCLFPVSCIS